MAHFSMIIMPISGSDPGEIQQFPPVPGSNTLPIDLLRKPLRFNPCALRGQLRWQEKAVAQGERARVCDLRPAPWGLMPESAESYAKR